MDDVLLIYADNPSINFDIFLKDFKQSECYLPPLKLEEAGDCTFLETTFEVTKDNNIKYWLKNTNEIGAPTKIWRYAHFDSYMPFAMKKAIMLACLKKVGKWLAIMRHYITQQYKRCTNISSLSTLQK